jgi:hypothetical protein
VFVAGPLTHEARDRRAPLHLYWSLRALRQGLSFESIRQLQIRYRLLYGFIGVMMAVTVLVTH